MTSFRSLVLGTALAVAAFGAALADTTPGQDWITMEQATQKVKDAGYSTVTKLEADDGRWEGEGVKNGQRMEFHVDPRSGAISNEHPDD